MYGDMELFYCFMLCQRAPRDMTLWREMRLMMIMKIMKCTKHFQIQHAYLDDKYHNSGIYVHGMCRANSIYAISELP